MNKLVYLALVIRKDCTNEGMQEKYEMELVKRMNVK